MIKLQKLRHLFGEHGIDGYIIPTSDEYISEYTSEYAKRLEYITGFTGSNGLAIVLRSKTLFFTDGRYLAQCAKQLDPKEFEIYDLALVNEQIRGKNLALGYDAMLFTEKQLAAFFGSNLKAITPNLIDQIWDNKPPHPSSDAYQYEIKYTGETSESKIEKCRNKMRTSGAKYLLLTASDSICWLLNIRASDVAISPVMLGYMVLGLDDMWFFTEPRKINIKTLPTHEIVGFLGSLDGKCMIDKSSCPFGLMAYIKEIVAAEDPCQIMKARKNSIEISCAIDVHIKDAIAACESFAWIMEASKYGITEYDIGLRLTEMRAQQDGYVMDSFPPIVGYKDNGAIIHYQAEQNTAKTLKANEGLLLIDSGGHYLGGTTDVTRVLAIGTPTDEQRQRYTDVLKGHIALACQKFPIGTSGLQLDVLARMHLWQNDLNYAHGTGHGVGNFLSVHEGPQRISGHTGARVALQKGMIISNEPGFYKNGEYGIRIENLVYVDEAGDGFLSFNNLTLVPYCKELIDFSRLTKEELGYLQEYNQKIMDNVYRFLSDGAKTWVSGQVTV